MEYLILKPEMSPLIKGRLQMPCLAWKSCAWTTTAKDRRDALLLEIQFTEK